MRKVEMLLFLITAALSSGLAWAKDCAKANELIRRAFAMQHVGDSNAQRVLYENALHHCPQHAVALNNMGVVLENEGQLAQAMTYYRQALAQQLAMPEALIGIGDLYQKRGQLRNCRTFDFLGAAVDSLAHSPLKGYFIFASTMA